MITNDRIKLVLGSIVGAVLIHLGWTALAPSPATAQPVNCTVKAFEVKPETFGAMKTGLTVAGEPFATAQANSKTYVLAKTCP